MLQTLMGDYPVTKQFRTHTEQFAFADVKGSPASAFKRVVRELEFDVAEMAIMTHLIAKAHGKPYRLLPFVVLARFQHPFLVYNAARGALAPEDLHGKRVGVRSYSVTTGAWIRQILAQDHRVDISRIQWVTFEEAHVAEFRDPSNVQRAPAGKEIMAMLQAGEIDAAIVGAVPKEENIQPVIKNPEAAGKLWAEKHGAIQLNHLVVVKNSVSRDMADQVYRLLVESKKAAGNPPMLPHGVEANRRNLEIAIDCAYDQALIPRRFTVDELFDREVQE
jgi:4,5-dihydroxyphthalate decarboxylase